MAAQLVQLGFTATAVSPGRDMTLYRQGGIALVVNAQADGQAAEFRAAHGPSANGMGFNVADVITVDA